MKEEFNVSEIDRFMSSEGNQRHSNPAKFYNPHAGQIIQKREHNQDHYEGGRDGYYSDPDMEAQYVYPNMGQNVDYHAQMQNMNYFGASPNIYARPGKQRNQSPYIVTHQMQFGGLRDYQEQHEQNRQARQTRYSRHADREITRQYEENSDFDEKEAHMFSSMSQAELKDQIIQNVNYEDYEQKSESEILIDQLYK